MTIELETKAGMSERALEILENLKGLLFESVSVKDKEFLEKQRELHQIHDDIMSGKTQLLDQDQYDKEMKQFWDQHENL